MLHRPKHSEHGREPMGPDRQRLSVEREVLVRREKSVSLTPHALKGNERLISPRLARALRIAAHAIDGGALISKAYDEGPIVIPADRLRAVPLGPRLRQLASGHLVICGYADPKHATCSLFAFIGVHRGDVGRLKEVLGTIMPSLHSALYSAMQRWRSNWPSLTPAEKAICRLLLEGEHNKEIAKCSARVTPQCEISCTPYLGSWAYLHEPAQLTDFGSCQLQIPQLTLIEGPFS